MVYVHQGKYKEALSEFQKEADLSGNSAFATGYLGYGYAAAGRRSEAEKKIEELKTRSQKQYVPAYAVP